MEKFAEAVYETMTGLVNPPFHVPEVESLFEPGMVCEQNYADMLDAYRRLCQRLGAGEEDRDCEEIINTLLDNQHTLAIAMFLKGYEFGQKGCPPYLHLSMD